MGCPELDAPGLRDALVDVLVAGPTTDREHERAALPVADKPLDVVSGGVVSAIAGGGGGGAA